MNYLFFDIECANSITTYSKICSLGYVLTDDKFNVISSEDILINPDGPFLVNDVPNFSLKYSEKEFRSNPKFPNHYNKIKNLLSSEDTIIMGHSVFNDCQYLNNEIIYWGLDSIDYSCFDTQVMYKKFSGTKDLLSLSTVNDNLETGHQDTAHDSLSDAYLTMNIAKAMCEKSHIGLMEFLDDCIDSKIEVKDYQIIRPLNTKFNEKKHLRFIHNVMPIHKMEHSLSGLNITISLNYERKHYKELCKIVQRIADMGGKYAYNVNYTDVFVKYTIIDMKEKEVYDARLRYAMKLIQGGKSIKVIELSELFEMLNLSESELQDIDDETLEVYFKGKNLGDKIQEYRINEIKEKKQEKNQVLEESLGNRFGDFFSNFNK